MLSRAIFTLALLHGVTLASPALAPLVVRAQCNQNNCLRVMTNTLAVASSFCSTWLQPTSTITVTPTVTISDSSTIFPTIPTLTVGPIIPAHISTQCTLTSAPPLTSRLSSACSCISVVPAAGTVTFTTYAPAVTDTISICDGVPSPSTFGGKVFDTACHTIYSGYILPGGAGVPDFPTCISTCAATTDCVAANFYTVSGQAYCQLIRQVSSVYVYTHYLASAAVLESYVANVGGLPAPYIIDF